MAVPEAVVLARLLRTQDEALSLAARIEPIIPAKLGPAVVFKAVRILAQASTIPQVATAETLIKGATDLDDRQKKAGLEFLAKAAALSVPTPDEVEVSLWKLVDLEKKKVVARGARSLTRAVETGMIKDAEAALEKTATDLLDLDDDEDRPKVYDGRDYRATEQGPIARGNLVPTGIRFIDKLFKGGCTVGDLVLIYAFLGECKSTFLAIATYNAIVAGFNTVYVDAETSRRSVQTKWLTLHTRKFVGEEPTRGLLYDDVENGGVNLTPKLLDLLKRAEDDWETNKDYGRVRVVDLGDTASALTVQSEVLQIRRSMGRIDMCGVDYFQFLEPIKDDEVYRLQVARTFKIARNMSRKFNNGEGLYVMSPHPTKQDARDIAEKQGYYNSRAGRESIEVGHKATHIIWLLATEIAQVQRRIKVGIAKNRDGSTGKLQGEYMAWEKEKAYIGELEVQPTDEEEAQWEDYQELSGKVR